MDKRFKEDGGRIMALAQTCATNGNYDLSIEAYEYIISYIFFRIIFIKRIFRKLKDK